MKKLTNEEVIKRIKICFGNKYDCTKVNYVNAHTNICLIDNETGKEKNVTLNNLFRDIESELKSKKQPKLTTLSFIKKAKEIHGDRYNYSKVNYVDYNETSVTIICPIHGEFSQKPNSHLQGCGCQKCGNERININRKYNTEQFIEKAIEIHGDKYDYSKVNYIDNDTDVIITCPIHGEFPQRPSNHLNGNGCLQCKIDATRLTKEEFVKRCNKKHNNKYDYSKVQYVNAQTMVNIICPIHGQFQQLAESHMNGCGCSICSESKGEKFCTNFLVENDINFEREKKFPWLGKQRIDFYLPDYNVGIEYQGRQHFIPVDFAGRGDEFAEQNLKDCIERDERKKRLCEENNLKLYYITYKENIEVKLDEILKNI